MKQEDYVSFDVAKLLKEKCLYNLSYPHDYCYYRDRFIECSALTNDMAEIAYLAPHLYYMQKWLREVANISVEVYTNASGWCWQICKAYKHLSVTCGTWLDDFTNHEDNEFINDCGSFDTYEQALNEGIKEALKMI